MICSQPRRISKQEGSFKLITEVNYISISKSTSQPCNPDKCVNKC